MKKIVFVALCLLAISLQNNVAQTADEIYFQWVDHYRHLLKQDKKAARTIYEAQLLEAEDYFTEEIEKAVSEEEKKLWQEAYGKTTDIIEEVYDEELKNLQAAFDKAIERLEEKRNERKKGVKEVPRRGTTRG
ncbi:MAG: hypothetical protein AAFZ15_07495 [Bacteroidota bacterium]